MLHQMVFFLNGRCYHVSYVGASILQTTNNRGESWHFSDINLTITIIQYTGQKSSVLAQSEGMPPFTST